MVGEVALAVMLLIGAGLMIRSLTRLWKVDPGFNPNHALSFSLSLPPAVSASPARTRVYVEQLRENLDLELLEGRLAAQWLPVPKILHPYTHLRFDASHLR